ncbi:MAG: hypothetical protein ACTSPB_26825 [Candidatus Thorarchaeota archaeon]
MRSKYLNISIMRNYVKSHFDMYSLYDAVEVAEAVGYPGKHRLIRYYLNRMTREGLLIKVVWKHRRRIFYGLKSLEYVFRTFPELFKRTATNTYEWGR